MPPRKRNFFDTPHPIPGKKSAGGGSRKAAPNGHAPPPDEDPDIDPEPAATPAG
jgi:hypothetical protein